MKNPMLWINAIKSPIGKIHALTGRPYLGAFAPIIKGVLVFAIIVGNLIFLRS